MPSLGRLSATLGLDNSELEQKARESGGTLKGLDARMRDVVNRAGQVGVALGAVGVALAVNLVAKAGEAAREIKQLAELSGATTRQFQKSAFAAREFGIESDKLADIFKDAQDRMGDFLTTGAGPMADFFESVAPKVGITADAFRNLSGPEVMQKFVAVMEDANISQQEMIFHMEAMAGDSSRLLPLLTNNAEALHRLGDEAESLGIVLSSTDLTRLEDGLDAINDLKFALQGAANVATASMAPAIQAIADGLTETLGDATEQSASDFVSWSEVVGDIMAFTADASVAAFSVIGNTFETVGKGIAGSLAAFVARTRGNYDEWIRISHATKEDIQGIWNLDELADNTSRFRDRLAEIRTEMERMQGLEPIRVTGGRRTPNIVDQQETEARQEAAKKQREIDEENARLAEQRERDLLEARLTMLRQSVMTEVEIETARHEQKLALLSEAREKRLIVEEEYNALEEQLEAEHMDRLVAIDRASMTALEKFKSSSFKQQTKTVTGELANMTAGVAQSSRTMFEINKAAGVANAIVNTATGVTKALAAYPPPVSFAMAAAQAAAGIAQVQAIRSQSFGGGSAPSIAGSTPAPPTSPVSSGAPGGEPQRVVAIEGLSPDQLFSGQQVRGLLEQIEDAYDDGAKVRIVT